MPKKIMDVLDALRREGVEIGDDAAASAKKTFGEMVIVESDKIVGEGQIAVKEESFENLRSDITTVKNENRKLTRELTEANEALNAGESTVKKQMERYKTENEQLRPIVEKFTASVKSRWDAWREKIPDELKPYYAFQVKDGDELTNDQIIANVSKIDEHVAIGALKAESPDQKGLPGGLPRKSPTGQPVEGAVPDWAGKSPYARMESGYGEVQPSVAAGEKEGEKEKGGEM